MQHIDDFLRKFSIKKNRGLLLISNPGLKTSSNYAPVTNNVIEHYKQFFMSIWGGYWSEELDDIQVIDESNPMSKNDIKKIIKDFNSYDYSIIVFCGHGGVSNTLQPFIELPNGEVLKQSELICNNIEGLRRIIIFDCCRAPTNIPDYLLEDLELEKYSTFDMEISKKFYNKEFASSDPHVEVINSTELCTCAHTNTNLDTVFSKALFEAIEQWKKRATADARAYKGECSVNYSHLSGTVCEKMKGHNQTPEFINYGNCCRLFPFLVVKKWAMLND